MTISISLGVIGLFKFLIWSWFNFDKGCILRKLSISFKFSICLNTDFFFNQRPQDSLDFFSVCYYVPFSSLIMLICTVSLCLLVNSSKGLIILLVFSKNQLCFDSLYLFVSVLLISALSLIISCCLFLLGVTSSCSRAFGVLLYY